MRKGAFNHAPSSYAQRAFNMPQANVPKRVQPISHPDGFVQDHPGQRFIEIAWAPQFGDFKKSPTRMALPHHLVIIVLELDGTPRLMHLLRAPLGVKLVEKSLGHRSPSFQCVWLVAR